MNSKIKTITLGIVFAGLALAVAPQASAQGFFGFSFDKHNRGRHISFNIGFPIGSLRAPVAHVHADYCNRWVPDHYEVRSERVWVPRTRRVWVPARYRPISRCGPRGRRLVRRGYWRIVPCGFHRNVNRRIFVPGHWENVCGF